MAAAASSSQTSNGCGPVQPFHAVSPPLRLSPLSTNKMTAAAPPSQKRRMSCMCSPTTHPGSFRCSLHKKNNTKVISDQQCQSPNRLNARRSAMKNSLVRIGRVEGEDLVRRALAALIRPSSHQQRRRCSEFKPMPSRLCLMSSANYEGLL